MVQEGLTGRLVPSGDVTALAEAIDGLLRNPERRQRDGGSEPGVCSAALRACASVEALLRAAFREAHGGLSLSALRTRDAVPHGRAG